jgi:hypothetical protein
MPFSELILDVFPLSKIVKGKLGYNNVGRAIKIQEKLLIQQVKHNILNVDLFEPLKLISSSFEKRLNKPLFTVSYFDLHLFRYVVQEFIIQFYQ